MDNVNKENVFFKLNKELEDIEKLENIEIKEKSLNAWKEELLINLSDKYNKKVKQLKLIDGIYDIDESAKFIIMNEKSILIIKRILADKIFESSNNKKSEDFLGICKIIKARENNLDFDLILSEMICGKNKKFPYKSFDDISIFKKLGYSKSNNIFESKSEKDHIFNIIEELPTEKLYTLISEELLDKKYFNKSKKNMSNINISYEEAKKEFQIFIENSLIDDDVVEFDLSKLLGININTKLLDNIKPNTNDNELNLLIEEAINRFYDKDDKQIAIEKLWDSFERLKTYFNNSSKDKKESSEKVVKIVSKDFDFELIKGEFYQLTNIGNKYRIRHHEKDKEELTERHRDYLFFRMLSLIDLFLSCINKKI